MEHAETERGRLEEPERKPPRAAPAPASPAAAALLALQRSHGNQAVARWVKVDKRNYPRTDESAEKGGDRLVGDYEWAGERLTTDRENRLYHLVSMKNECTAVASYRELTSAIDVSVLGVDDAVEWIAGAPKFDRGGAFVLTDPSRAVTRLQGDTNLRVVLAGPLGNIPPAVAPRVRATNAEGASIVRGMIERRSGMTLNAPGAAKGKTIVQYPQERGDMHDVRPALALDPNLRVIVGLSNRWDTWIDAAEILNYYRGYDSQVFFTMDTLPTPSTHQNERGRFAILSASRATTLLEKAMGDHDGETVRTAIKQATTGAEDISDEEAKEYERDLDEHHWDAIDKPIVLVNFRDSGHVKSEVRALSHPELDTGTEGFAQLLKAVGDAGMQPVPMGHLKTDELAKGPNLFEYWRWPCCAEKPGQPRRLREYRLMRFIAERYKGRVFGLAMRSGSTDAMVFSGIPTISLDLKLDTVPQDEFEAAGLGTGPVGDTRKYHYGHGRSWKRAEKRVDMFPGVFHQEFLQTLRADPGVKRSDWKGTIADDDIKTIGEALAKFAESVPEEKSERVDTPLVEEITAKVIETLPSIPKEEPKKVEVVEVVKATVSKTPWRDLFDK